MEQSAKDTWKRLLDKARARLPENTLRTWLEPAEAVSFEDDRLLVATPDQFAAEWNESKHARMLSEMSAEIFGRRIEVNFRVQEERARRPQMDFFVAAPAHSVASQAGGPAPWALPLNERYTFERFVVGKSNELAAAAAYAVAEAPGKAYNPLFIYGATGLGKTHLMQAIAHSVIERSPGTRSVYVQAEQFVNEYIDGIHANRMADFRRRYRNEVDLLLVDDVHFFEGKEATQEEFFHTFNSLHGANKQIVVTSDRPPNEIPGLEARLVSRRA
jgi:chromosomal replication initiator protein